MASLKKMNIYAIQKPRLGQEVFPSPSPSRLALGTTQPPVQQVLYQGYLPRVKRGGVRSTHHLHLASRVRMSTADPPLFLCVCTACYGETFTFTLYTNPPATAYTKVSCFEMIRRDVCSRPLCWQLFRQLCGMTQPCMEAGRGTEVHVKPSFCTLLRFGSIGPAPATLNLGKRLR